MVQDNSKPSDNRKPHPWAHLEPVFKPILAKCRGESFSPTEFAKAMETVMPEIELSAESIFNRHHIRNAKELAGDATQNWLFEMFFEGGFLRYNDLRPFYRYGYSMLYWICLGRKYRDDDRRVTALGFDPEDDRQNPVREATRLETANKVRQAVDGLPSRQREALILEYWIGAKLSKVARQRGESETALHMRAFHGRAALRGQLANLDWK